MGPRAISRSLTALGGEQGLARSLLKGKQCVVGPGFAEPTLAQEHLSPSLSFEDCCSASARASCARVSRPASRIRADRFPGPAAATSIVSRLARARKSTRLPAAALAAGEKADLRDGHYDVVIDCAATAGGPNKKGRPRAPLRCRGCEPRRGGGIRRCEYRFRSGRRSRQTTAPELPFRWRAWPASTPCPRYLLAPPARCR